MDYLKLAKEALNAIQVNERNERTSPGGGNEINESNEISPLRDPLSASGVTYLVSPEVALRDKSEKRDKSPGWEPNYAFPWPDSLDFGPRTVHPFDSCAECGVGTWVHYGPRPLCLPCAQSRAMR